MADLIAADRHAAARLRRGLDRSSGQKNVAATPSASASGLSHSLSSSQRWQPQEVRTLLLRQAPNARTNLVWEPVRRQGCGPACDGLRRFPLCAFAERGGAEGVHPPNRRASQHITGADSYTKEKGRARQVVQPIRCNSSSRLGFTCCCRNL